jgi:hypothetical protein
MEANEREQPEVLQGNGPEVLDEVIKTLDESQRQLEGLFEAARKLARENAFLREIAGVPKLDDDAVNIKAWVDKQQKAMREQAAGRRAVRLLQDPRRLAPEIDRVPWHSDINDLLEEINERGLYA